MHPRTAVAIDERGEKQWLMVVDGRQQHDSEGSTLAELTDIALELRADKALNFDGGATGQRWRSRSFGEPTR